MGWFHKQCPACKKKYRRDTPHYCPDLVEQQVPSALIDLLDCDTLGSESMAIGKRQFMHIGSKAQCTIAEKIANDILAAVGRYDGQIPLALAVGVLRVVEVELLKNNEAI